METIETTYPLELLSVDYLTVEEKGRKINLLVVMDHFTKFAQVIVTKDQTAKNVAKALWDEFFLLYGFPSRILTDQGRDFESRLIHELCRVADIKKCRTTPYHPSGNPVERFNRTLIGMLRSLEEEKKTDWRKQLRSVVHAYNARIHESTGYSPFFLFFGRHPRLPIDLAFDIELEGKQKVTPQQYVRQMKNRLAEAYKQAKTAMEKSASKNKARYDESARAAELEVGDRCLARKVGPRVKVDDRWERTVYKVIAKHDSLPVYTVVPEDGDGLQRTLHRNLLLPVGVLDAGEETVLKRPVPRPRRTIRQIKPVVSDVNSDESQIEIHVKLDVNAPEFVPVARQPVVCQRETCDADTASSHDSNHKTRRADTVDREQSQLLVSSREATDVNQASGQEPEGDLTTETEESTDDEIESGNNATVTAVGKKSTESYDGDESGESDSESDTSEQRDPEVEQSQLNGRLRRSTRERRPVDRLNLAHVVKNVQHQQCRPNGLWGRLDERLMDTVQYRINMLRDQPIAPNRVRVMEQMLKVFLNV
jgi:hypothetical protein